MSQNQQYRDKFRTPELFLSELLKKSAKGQFHERDENVPFLHRATVVAVDTAGGSLENPDGQGHVNHLINGEKVTVDAVVGLKNPRNSVKARIISDGFDQFVSDDRLRVFWPFFPEHVSVPIKPGEHVYVIFEDTDYEHGLWVTKIPGQDNVNFFRGQSSFVDKQAGSLSNKFSDTKGLSQDEKRLNTDAAAGESVVKEGRLAGLYPDDVV